MGNGSELGKVRGLGAAHGGTDHWMGQRYTAVANLLLGLWLFASLVLMPTLDHWAVAGWIAQPFVAVPLILFIVSIFNHLRLGLQVLVEDYVHDEGLKFATMMIVNFYAIGGAALGIFSVAKIAFGAGV